MNRHFEAKFAELFCLFIFIFYSLEMNRPLEARFAAPHFSLLKSNRVMAYMQKMYHDTSSKCVLVERKEGTELFFKRRRTLTFQNFLRSFWR